MYLIEPMRNGQYIYDGAVALAIQVHVLNKLNLDEDIIFPLMWSMSEVVSARL